MKGHETTFYGTDLERHAELLRLSDAATPGPWIRAYGSYDVHHMGIGGGGPGALRSMEDIDFAVACVSFVRDMLSERIDSDDRLLLALRSHAFSNCTVCGAAVDEPEAFEACPGPFDHMPGPSVDLLTPEQHREIGGRLRSRAPFGGWR